MGALSVYLDASVLISLFIVDAHSANADSALKAMKPTPVISDFAAAEFSSAISRRVRTRDLTIEEAQTALANFDVWIARAALWVETVSADMAASTILLRRFDLRLRTPDALNIAIAQRVGAQLFSFDKRMAEAARALGLQTVQSAQR